MKRLAVLTYGIIAYLMFHTIFLYLIGFTGNLLVPKSIDGPLQVPMGQAILTNTLLIVLFALQHSVMARPKFKAWWTQYVPEPIERSTYLVFTFFALAILFAFWQPMGGIIWTVENKIVVGILWVIFAMGWLTVVLSSFLINHFDLFGLRQVWFYFRQKPYTNLPFGIPMLYKMVRHPLYLGLLMSFWAAPVMSFTRLFFAVGLTAYILRAIQLEEKDLLSYFGDKYREYQKQVPMIFPWPFGKRVDEPKMETIIKRDSEFIN